MDYVLAMLSHGYPHSATAEKTLTSFSEHVDRPPAFAIYYHDGPGVAYAAQTASEYEAVSGGAQIGFCGATRALWIRAARAAIDRGVPYVFWLEHDFRFLRPFRIRELALVLRDARIAQIALVRGPVNREEKQAGSVLARHGDRHVVVSGGHIVAKVDDQTFEVDEHVQHDYYFTTNPSLMRTGFMRENPFPAEGRECEGRFGIQLRERGYGFAVLGDGVEEYVEHIGIRNGFGY